MLFRHFVQPAPLLNETRSRSPSHSVRGKNRNCWHKLTHCCVECIRGTRWESCCWWSSTERRDTEPLADGRRDAAAADAADDPVGDSVDDAADDAADDATPTCQRGTTFAGRVGN